MKFLAPLFITSVFAVSLDLRDPKIISRQAVNDIQGHFSTITSAVEALGEAVRTFNGPDQALAVNGAAAAVSAALRTAISDVNDASPLTQEDALTLGGPTGDLNTAVIATLTELVAKRSIFVDNGFGEIVYNTLLEQQELSAEFSEAVVNKIPQGIRDIARGLSQPSADANAEAVEAFRDSGSETRTATSTPQTTPINTPAHAPPTTTKAPASYQTPVSNISNISNIKPTPTGAGPAYTPSVNPYAPTKESSAPPTPSAPVEYDGGATSNGANFGAFAAVALAVVAVI